MPGYLFRVLENRANSLFQVAIAGRNLTTRQFGVLFSLARHGAMTQTELAEKTASDKSTLGEMVVRMKQRGLLTRVRGTDRRSFMIALTDEGRALVTDIAPVVVKVQEQLMLALPEEYRLIFLKCLKLLAAHNFEPDDASSVNGPAA